MDLNTKRKRPILRPEEEEEIVRDMIEKVNRNEPVSRDDVIKKVVKFIRSDSRKNPFRNETPGDKWFTLFRRRNNETFMKLDPEKLRILEQVGFVEKRGYNTNIPVITKVEKDTVSNSKISKTIMKKNQPKLSNSISERESLKEMALVDKPSNSTHSKPTERQMTPVNQASNSSLSTPTAAMFSPSMSDESCNTTGTEEGDRSQESQSDSTDFQPGSKLEVMDFNEKWYPVKVVEVDYEEGEVLVHFEKWSNRYDEWVRMDSNRIRRPRLPSSSSSKKVFVENEKVIAVWAYNRKYPATVCKVLPDDKYEVLFCDGYAKILRGCKLFKATEEDLKNNQPPPPKKPAPPMGADPLDPDLGPKEERRLKKRKMDVLESYRPHKRQRLDQVQLTPESSPKPTTSMRKPYETPKIILKGRGRPPGSGKLKKSVEDLEDDEYYDDEWVENDDDDDDDDDDPHQADQARKKIMKKKQFKTKNKYEDSGYKLRYFRAGLEEDSERWNTEIPEGVSPVQIKDTEGYYRESVIIPDKKLPQGWAKHTMLRRNGAKWDVFLVNPAGRKFRSRNELRNYFAELKEPFPEDSFDFMVGRKMEMIRSQVETRKKLLPGSPLLKSSPTHKRSPIHKKYDGKGDSESKVEEQKKVKTMLPKGRQTDSTDEGKGGPSLSPSSPTFASPPFPLTELRTADGSYTCCGKSFRKENLFQMHMKHYHPEYSNLFGSTPNVADLAYARTVGEPLEDSRAEAMVPSLVERVNKYEAERKALSDIHQPLDISGSKQDLDKQSESVTQTVTEDMVSTLKEEDQPIPVKDEKVADDPVFIEPEEDKKLEAKDLIKKESDAIIEDVIPPAVSEEKANDSKEKKEDSATSLTIEESVSKPAGSSISEDPPMNTVAPSLSIMKPVSKPLTSEAVNVQTTSSPKTPVTITKYIPPGQKASGSMTKVTISVSSTDKESKPTIKTLLPMRPPPLETNDIQESQKPKEIKSKENVEEEIISKPQEATSKSRPRKRTVSESFPKKPKLAKAATGSLEEELVESTEVTTSPTASSSTSYRFSRNRSQLPRVSLEKLNITPDSNGRVVLATPENKISPVRRPFKNFKAANNISKRPKDLESEPQVPTEQITTPDTTYDNLRKEEIINCTCGYMEEDGLMIQCDLCLCWQHGLCNNINKEADVPEKYVCYICQHPPRQRKSQRHLYNMDWIKEGKLPSLSFAVNDEESVEERESRLKRSHDIVASLIQLKTVIHSLRVKTHIATKPDHPKLYLWAKSWKNNTFDVKNKTEEDEKTEEVRGPQPEAAIDETECRLKLLEHVEDYQHQVDDRLTSIQVLIAGLESEDPDLASDEASDHYPVTKQTIQMLLRDLKTVEQFTALN